MHPTARAALLVLPALLALASARADTPPSDPLVKRQFSWDLQAQGIVGGSLGSRIDSAKAMLQALGARVTDLQFTCHNGYGKPLCARITFEEPLPVNKEILDNARALRVTVNPWTGDIGPTTSGRIAEIRGMEQLPLGIQITGVNGYGKVLEVNVLYISRYKYEELVRKATPPAAP